MFRFVVALVALAYASAFAPARVARSSSAVSMNMEGMSKSVPFLRKPKNLDGLVGNYEFDPIGFSDYMNVKWMAEAELKHGRVAMLAVVGWLVTQAGIHLPGELYDTTNPIDAAFKTGPAVLGQIFVACGALESINHGGKMSMEDMHKDGQEIGKYGAIWGSNQLKGKSAQEVNDIKLKELKNGRLAMLAIGGLVHHTIITGSETLGSFPSSNLWVL